MRRSVLAALLALAVGASAVGLAGCGGGEEVSPTPEEVEGTLPAATTQESPATTLEGDAEAGEAIFKGEGGCGACHALAAAGTTGTVGPNLDDSKPPLELAVDRITNGAGAMPAFEGRLDPQQIADVAAYVVESSSG